VSVSFDDESFVVVLSDERKISVPLRWFPRLQRASPKQRKRFELSNTGIHWEELDEDISIAGLLGGKADRTRTSAKAA
jgi:Protein of unknown function (DUF2442)